MDFACDCKRQSSEVMQVLLPVDRAHGLARAGTTARRKLLESGTAERARGHGAYVSLCANPGIYGAALARPLPSTDMQCECVSRTQWAPPGPIVHERRSVSSCDGRRPLMRCAAGLPLDASSSFTAGQSSARPSQLSPGFCRPSPPPFSDATAQACRRHYALTYRVPPRRRWRSPHTPLPLVCRANRTRQWPFGADSANLGVGFGAATVGLR